MGAFRNCIQEIRANSLTPRPPCPSCTVEGDRTQNTPFCDECGGCGAVNRLPLCPECNGTGRVERTRRDGTGVVQLRLCLACYGTGESGPRLDHETRSLKRELRKEVMREMRTALAIDA